jgi:hypothetical protein
MNMASTTEAIAYRSARQFPRRRAEHVMRQGVVVGLIGAAVAMLLFLVVDLAAGVPLRTPAMLGSALFHGLSGGASDAREAAITTRVVLGYTAVHVTGFVLFGLAVSGLFAIAEREKRVLALIFMLGCCLAAAFVMMVYGLSQWVRDAMTPWVFLAGHVLAGAAVVIALFYFHRRLLREFPTSAE